MSVSMEGADDAQKDLARRIIAVTAMRTQIDNQMKETMELYRVRRKEINDAIDELTRELARSFGIDENAAFSPDPENVPVFLEKEKPRTKRKDEQRLRLVRGLLDEGGR